MQSHRLQRGATCDVSPSLGFDGNQKSLTVGKNQNHEACWKAGSVGHLQWRGKLLAPHCCPALSYHLGLGTWDFVSSTYGTRILHPGGVQLLEEDSGILSLVLNAKCRQWFRKLFDKALCRRHALTLVDVSTSEVGGQWRRLLATCPESLFKHGAEDVAIAGDASDLAWAPDDNTTLSFEP